jgi:hypothetical protein
MKRSQPLLFFFTVLMIFPAVARAQAQPWSGIIDPARATDWTHAGVRGGIRSANWTQCGATIAAYSGTAATINTALAACGSNQYALLGPGTFNLTTGIIINQKNNVVLRGSGANSTFVVMSGSSGCGSFPSVTLCITGQQTMVGAASPVAWTAGFSRGTTVITLANVANITPNSTVVVLDQCSDGLSGDPCAPSTGTTQFDNGNYFVCETEYNWASRSGCSQNGQDGNERPNRGQTEAFQVSAVNSVTKQVTLIGSLRNPNWRTSQTLQAWLYQPAQYDGIENLSFDASRIGGTMFFIATANCWVTGVRFVKPGYAGVWFEESIHGTIESNYSSGTSRAPGVDSEFLVLTLTADMLIDNNISHNTQRWALFDGPDIGSVISYNFIINNNVFVDSLEQDIFPHSIDNFELYEGNVLNAYPGENIHGPKLMNTGFRNLFKGWESCGGGSCLPPPAQLWSPTTNYTQFLGNPVAYPSLTSGFYYLNYAGGSRNLNNIPGASTCGSNPCWIVLSKSQALDSIFLPPYNRYHNIVGNILGTPGVTKSNAQQIGSALGASGQAGSLPADPITGQTLLRWGNYDATTGNTFWCGNSSDTGWSSTCASTSQVPTGAPLYPNPIPTIGDTGAGMSSLSTVPSFYLSAKPSYWGALPWPGIGPDITDGNVGQCSGSQDAIGQFATVAALTNAQCTGTSLTTPAWGGHINANPAMNCALNVMGMPPDGSGGVLSFNSHACYGGSSSSQGPNPPTNLIVVPN